jgi:hypothetical protein
MANFVHTLERFLENCMVKRLFCTLLIAGIILVQFIPHSLLLLVKELYVQVIFAVLIAYLACVEPIYALLLTLFFAVCIYEVNNKSLALQAVAMKLHGNSKGNIYSAQSGACGGMDSSMDTVYRYLNDERSLPVPNTGLNEVSHRSETVDEIISNRNLQGPVVGDNMQGPNLVAQPSTISFVDMEPAAVSEARGWSHPSSRTMTENLRQMGTGFVSDANLSQVQVNTVTGIDPDSVAEFKGGILNAQGITVAPRGFDPVGSRNSIPLI